MAARVCKQMPPTSLLLCLLSVAMVALLTGADGMEEARLRFYMHDIVTGPNVTAVVVANRTAAQTKMVNPAVPFGVVVVFDDLLTEGPSPSSRAVGRAQGMYVFASMSSLSLLVSMNVVLTAGQYNGSTLAITGWDDIPEPVRELSVVGGSVRFRMARGYVLWTTVTELNNNAVLQLDVFVHAQGQ